MILPSIHFHKFHFVLVNETIFFQFEHIKSKDFFTALKEEDELKERERFKDPMVLLIKETCDKAMHRQQDEQSTLVSPRQSLIHSRISGATERDRSSRAIRSSTFNASVGGATERDRSPLATAQPSFSDMQGDRSSLASLIDVSVTGGTDDHTDNRELRDLETGSRRTSDS